MLMMKNYFDQFYEVLHKNSIKRRRMISLLLVLSMFVSSSVVWGLRGTVVTMVNEPDEVLEEMPDADETEAEKLAYHVHTDDCYEDVLICELEENEEHIHTEECYEKQLVCGFEDEKEADASAEAEVTGEDEAEAAEAPETEEVESAETEETEESEDEEEVVLDAQLPEMMMAAGPQVMADAPAVKATADNRADGIHINLFDFGPSSIDVGNNNLQRVINNYDNWASSFAQGVNAGRTNENDILFFAYGTPNTNRETDPYTPLRPEKNHYAGNYDMGSGNDAFPGNRPVQGIVNRNLNTEGYPSVSSSGNSLKYLFEPVSDGTTKTVYEDVNKLLTKDTDGKYHHNSNENYAYYNTDTDANPDKEFTVYSDTFNIVNDDHHFETDTNQKTNTTYGTDNGYPMAIGFFPFNQYDDTHKDPNFNAVLYDEDQEKTVSDRYYNHHFGMTMDANFVLPADGLYNSQPVVFDYSGDDDMWVYLDDMLILDVGGIHEPASGRVDFTNGYVWVQDDQLPEVMKNNPNFNLQNFLTDKGDETSYQGFAFAGCTQGENGQIYDENGIPWTYDEYTYPF